MTKNIADTGFLYALYDQRDQHHSWAIAKARPENAFFTCDAVIAETAYLLKKRMNTDALTEFLYLLEINVLTIDFDANKHIKRVRELLKRYSERMDFADACLVVMTEQEEYKDCVVFTTDRTDFSIYRRHGRSAIPILAP